MEEIKYAFFVDFDGTITTKDVCFSMVTKFAKEGWEEINTLWENKEISTIECAKETFKLFKTNNIDEYINLFDSIEIDPGFKDFISFCKNKNYPIYILSDGYHLYIEYILKSKGIDLPYYANTLKLTPSIGIETPYYNKECDLCGVCKKNLMEELLKEGQISIYIGDGYSDFCPGKAADIVFAKKSLLKHLRPLRDKVYSYENFFDIIIKLNELLEVEL